MFFINWISVHSIDMRTFQIKMSFPKLEKAHEKEVPKTKLGSFIKNERK